MSLFGSLFSGVSGMAAQSTAMGVISDNISNVNTVGYKGTSTRFSTLVTGQATASSYSPGGVRPSPFKEVSRQGLVQASQSATDIAIAGAGLFVVNSQADGTGDVLYTRAGSFHEDNLGQLINTAGFYLQGWPLDNNGLLPGEPGNTTNTTSSSDISSLESVNVRAINGVAASTTTVAIGANLKAGEATFTGAQGTTQSLSLAATAVLPLTAGDEITFTAGSETLTVTFNNPPGAGEFSTLNELADLINASTGFSAAIGGTATDATLTVTAIDPREDLVISDATSTPTDDLFGAASPITSTGTYDATDSSLNMASGSVTPDFSRSVRVFDAQGTGHDLGVAFLKVGGNTWAVEVYAIPETDVSIGSPLVDGQIATGTIAFNGDASLNSVSTALSNALSIDWTSGAVASSITIDWGTQGVVGTGLTDGLTQFDGQYNVGFINQNGSEVGEFNGVTIDPEGFVIVSFSNGQTKRIYKVPVATFGDPSQLAAKNGNVYQSTDASGQFNLRQAGRGGAGVLAPSALEAANVDLAKEFTDMIITQRAFSAASQVITTVDDMLDDLIRLRR